ncbi:aldose 1-epimerase family protein [Desulforamulus ruminis]|uniref:Aldose 1-epimerase n=1 Tax=Desulforamulus ruminis (strain ATCC 23193 / DSM 2154 / NCIMB 8452 / DL) TaxID=696281 RepID=F6DQR3_DESRL|nr:aldose 1-epimerase family protein [Desulforamulus ruminis]AEG62060.1 hypothetical protein Desru_3860 [Desulforamulus ruminis DSM 2154]
MVQLYGQFFTRQQLRERIGHESQIGGVRRLALTDGNQKDVEVIEFRTGSGLHFQVSPTRGMDIILAEYKGKAIGWRSRTGEVAPAYLETHGFIPRRGSFGGLVCTCGYSQVGNPCHDQGQEHCLHGRAQLSPATNVWAEAAWDGDEYKMWCQGKVIELDKFTEYFVNERRIETSLGANMIRIKDCLTNHSFQTQGHMMLYHINLGFPLLSGHTRLYAPSSDVRHRDKPSVDFDWTRYPLEPHTQVEDVLYHEMEADEEGYVTMALINETPGKARWGLQLRYTKESLPNFVHWFQPSPGAYVMGLEPSNCWVDGRAAHRERGELVMLEPGEQHHYEVEFKILDGEEEITSTLEKLKQVEMFEKLK